MSRGESTVRLILWIALGTGMTACGGSSEPETTAASGAIELAHFPLDAGEVPRGDAATFDASVSRDGRGSLRVEASRDGLLRLYDLDDVGFVQGQVVLTGFLRSRGLDGQAMLEMRCQPREGDEAFVRGARGAVAGDAGWTPQEIRFSDPTLCRDPASIRINLLIRGSGTVWIDDLRLWSVASD